MVGTCRAERECQPTRPVCQHIKQREGRATYTATISNHKVNGLATAVLRRAAAASAVADAVDLANAAGESGDDLLGAIDRDLLAGTEGGVGRSGVATEAGGGGGAALHLGGAGALAADRGAGAVALPAAVAGSAVGAAGLGAAADIARVPGAGTGDAGTTGGGAGGGGDADTWKSTCQHSRSAFNDDEGAGEESVPARPPEPMQGSLRAAMAVEAAKRRVLNCMLMVLEMEIGECDGEQKGKTERSPGARTLKYSRCPPEMLPLSGPIPEPVVSAEAEPHTTYVPEIVRSTSLYPPYPTRDTAAQVGTPRP